MRRVVLWALSTLSALVLLFSYHTSTSSEAATSAAAPVAPGASSGTGGGSSSGSTSPGSGSSGSGSSGSTRASGTFAGDAVGTRWGVVQVQVTVSAGRITKADVLQVPWNNPRDQEINSQAVPVLNQEVVRAQSAQIDMVSGATVTSDGYLQSLQSAIDKANL